MALTLNLGILAHIDAGKTSLTERLLHSAGVIETVGSVDEGSTQTDSLALERQRGITIKSAVVSFEIEGITVNLIDTPGHPDFIAEVERVLGVLDGAVLVISAVEGVQAQTRVLMRTLRRLEIPTLIFVNKIDRSGARYDSLLRDIAERLTPTLAAMGETRRLGARDAGFLPFGEGDAAFTTRLVDLLAAGDDELLAAYVQDESSVSHADLRAALAAQTRRALVHPVFFGSAITGAGVEPLIRGIRELLPATEGDAAAPLAATVFKVERGAAGEKIAYVRMFGGTLRLRERLCLDGQEESKVTTIGVFESGTVVHRPAVGAGRIGKVWGLHGAKVGDTFGNPPAKTSGRLFFRPSLETLVVPCLASEKGRLHEALTQLAEQDPLINLRQDDLRQEIYVSLYGEVQKEVIQATLKDDYGIDVTFRETTPICVERPIGVGSAFEIKNKDPNPFLATVGLRIEPAPENSGVGYRLEVELGSMPFAFMKAVEDTVRETLRQGLYGWEVTDCTVTLTHSGYCPRQSHAHQRFNKAMSSTGADFRGLTPLVVIDALREAGTRVHEPVHRFHLEVASDTVGVLMPVLAGARAVVGSMTNRGNVSVLEGELPAAEVHGLQQQLPPLTHGDGVLEAEFARYQPVSGEPPSRPRSDHNPLDRKEYLLHFTRGV
ncbi:elongation factor G [Streptomyces hoynatensis]|uniref:GTP-binding protein n=1 Tax=Streptomyces hoynatensis TaxID=1141874 RepID=A0A3A9Z9R8_9ACTN|nr:TetM/TetW/TetO/TetS family tetracycline resistance ribosomal protection protein [Streptomyces hoynatensis]RKN44889.1 GTP-binding protein [Streptomyces hoynatensis]